MPTLHFLERQQEQLCLRVDENTEDLQPRRTIEEVLIGLQSES